MNENPGGRCDLVFEHLNQASVDLDTGVAPSSPEAPQNDLLSADELDEMREIRDLVEELSCPAPVLVTTN